MISLNVTQKSYQGIPKAQLSSSDIASIVNQVKIGESTVEISPEDLVQKIAVEKHHFTPCVMEGTGKKDDNWVSSNLIVLDIDNDSNHIEQWMTPEDVITKCEMSGISPLVLYYTDSHNKKYITNEEGETVYKPKFRAVFYFNPGFDNKKQWQEVAQRLAGFLTRNTGIVDKASWTPTQFYFGGENMIDTAREYLPEGFNLITSYEPVDFSQLYEILASDAAKYGDPIKKTSTPKTVKEVEKKRRNLISRLKNFPQEDDNVTYQEVELPEVIEHVEIDELVPYCKVLQSFKQGYWVEDEEAGVEGGGRLNNNDLFALKTNLQYIKGGVKWLEDHVKDHVKRGLQEKRNHPDKKALLTKAYAPTRLENFSPYPSDHIYTNILSLTGKGIYGLPKDDKTTQPKTPFSLEDAQKELDKSMHHAFNPAYLPSYLNNYKPEHTLVKIVTGIGKTTRIIEKALEEVKMVRKDRERKQNGEIKEYYTHRLPVIAFKTHALKNEAVEKVIDMLGEEETRKSVLQTPDVPDLGEKTNNLVAIAYASGKERQASKIINQRKRELEERVANNRGDVEKAKEMVKSINQYNKSWDRFYAIIEKGTTMEQVIFTTHDKAIQTNRDGTSILPHKHIIFDENPQEKHDTMLSTNIPDIDITLNILEDLTLEDEEGAYEDIPEQLSEFLQGVKANIKSPEGGKKTYNVVLPKAWYNVDKDTAIDKTLNKAYEKIAASMLQNDEIGRMKTNPLFLINAQWYRKDRNSKRSIGNLYFYKVNPYPNDVKLTILSATLPREIEKSFSKDKTKFFDISNVKHEGVISQLVFENVNKHFRSYSKTAIANQMKKDNEERHEIYQDIVEQQDDPYAYTPVITFKSVSDELNPQEPIECWFGNSEGIDKLNGREIIVIGDYTPPYDVIILKATAIYGNLPEFQNPSMKKKMVRKNGYAFPVWTFENDKLSNLHLEIREGELVQAVGRARALRNPDAHVRVISSLPLAIN